MVDSDGIVADRHRSATPLWWGAKAAGLAALLVLSSIAAPVVGADEPILRDRPAPTAEAAKPEGAIADGAERQRRLLILLLINNAALRPLGGFGR